MRLILLTKSLYDPPIGISFTVTPGWAFSNFDFNIANQSLACFVELNSCVEVYAIETVVDELRARAPSAAVAATVARRTQTSPAKRMRERRGEGRCLDMCSSLDEGFDRRRSSL